MLFLLYSYIQISVISSCQLCLLATGLHVYDESGPPPTITSTGRIFFSHEFLGLGNSGAISTSLFCIISFSLSFVGFSGGLFSAGKKNTWRSALPAVSWQGATNTSPPKAAGAEMVAFKGNGSKHRGRWDEAKCQARKPDQWPNDTVRAN